MDRANYDYRLDPPREVESWPCDACNESGYLCVSPECFVNPETIYTRRVRTELCLANHFCPMCGGEGRIYSDGKDEREYEID